MKYFVARRQFQQIRFFSLCFCHFKHPPLLQEAIRREGRDGAVQPGQHQYDRSDEGVQVLIIIIGNGHDFFIGILTEQKHKGISYWHFKLTSGCFTFSFYSFSCEMMFIDRIMPSIIMTIISLMPTMIKTIISLMGTMIKIPPGAPTPTGPDGWEAGKPRNWAIDSRSADAEGL